MPQDQVIQRAVRPVDTRKCLLHRSLFTFLQSIVTHMQAMRSNLLQFSLPDINRPTFITVYGAPIRLCFCAEKERCIDIGFG